MLLDLDDARRVAQRVRAESLRLSFGRMCHIDGEVEALAALGTYWAEQDARFHREYSARFGDSA